MLTDKPPIPLSPLEQLCLLFLLRVRGLKDGTLYYPERDVPENVASRRQKGPSAEARLKAVVATPVTIERIAAEARPAG